VTAPPDRDDVVAMIAALGNRDPASVPEDLDSMERVWLVHQVEQRYGVHVELTDDEQWAMSSVSDAVDALRRAFARASGGGARALDAHEEIR
jgi:acyl carrier protein